MSTIETRFSAEQAVEVRAELARQGFEPCDRFTVSFFDDGRIAAVWAAPDGPSAAWGPEIYTV